MRKLRAALLGALVTCAVNGYSGLGGARGAQPDGDSGVASPDPKAVPSNPDGAAGTEAELIPAAEAKPIVFGPPASLVDSILRCGQVTAEHRGSCLDSSRRELERLLEDPSTAILDKTAAEVSPSSDVARLVLKRAQALQSAIGSCSNSCAGERWKAIEDALTDFNAAAKALALLTSRDVVLVSRGGISLGNWQAGFLFGLTEGLKTRKTRLGQKGPLFPVIAGASAGAVNAIGAAASGCGQNKLTPDQSIYHKVWLPMGLRSSERGVTGLAQGKVGRLHLFSEESVLQTVARAQAHIEENQDGIAQGEPCRVLVGLSTTHLYAQRIPIDLNGSGGGNANDKTNGSLIVSRQKEVFRLALNFTAEERGARLSGQNYLPSSKGGRRLQAVLGHDPDGLLKTDLVFDAARASGAFPVAFPPVTLPYTFADERAQPRMGVFIDGGTFDNMPLGVAVQLHRQYRQQGDRAISGLPPLVAAAHPHIPAVYLLLEPNVESWAAADAQQSEARRRADLPATYLGFGGAMLSSNKDSGIADALNSYPELLDQNQVFVPKRRLPVAGVYLSAFLAFAERDFREFDFYVGVADALHALRDYKPLLSSGRDSKTSLRALQKEIALDEGNPRLGCLLDYFDSELSWEPILRRVVRDDLPSSCRGSIDNFAALLVASHNMKVRSALNDDKNPLTGDGTKDFIGEAVAAKFNFADTGIAPDSAEAVLSEIRGIFAERIGQLGDQQEDVLSRRLVGVGGQVAADALTVTRWPQRTGGLGMTQFGIDAYMGWNAQRWWLTRLEFGGKVFRFDKSRFDDDRSQWRFEVEPYVKSSLVRVGDNVLTSSLIAGLSAPYFLALRKDVTRYDQLNLQGILGIETAVLQTVALRTDFEWRLSKDNLVGVEGAHRITNDRRWRLFATIAYQFNGW